MAELSSYPPVTTLAGTERIPVITTPGVAGGNKYITADNLALFTGGGGGGGAGAADGIRYVSTAGNDSDDGLSWGSAFLTIQAAIDDLGGLGGLVYVGCGVFTITTPIIVPNRTIVQGSGSGQDNNGTHISAHATFTGAGMFQSSTWPATDWWHWSSIRDMEIDGNNVATALIAIYQMGEASDLRNLHLHSHAGCGILAKGIHAPFTLFNCTINGGEVAGSNYGLSFEVGGGVCRIYGLSGDGNLLAHVRINGAEQVLLSGLKSEAHPVSTVLIDGVGNSGGAAASVFFAGGYDQNITTGSGADQIVLISGNAQPSVTFAGYGFTVNGTGLLINDAVRGITIPSTFGSYVRKSLFTYGVDDVLGGSPIILTGGKIRGQRVSTGALHDMLRLDSGDNVLLRACTAGTVALMEAGGAAKVTIDSTGIGFNAVTPVAQSTGWAVSNVTTDKVFNANATTIDELADVLGTLITYLISRGDLAA